MNRGRALLGAALVLLAASAHAAEFPIETHDGQAYVELTRIAAALGARLDGTVVSARAHLRTGVHVVTFTRNWAQVIVDGKALVLDAPVRVKQGKWLVPRTFVTRVLPGLGAGQTAASTRSPGVVARASAVSPVPAASPRTVPSATENSLGDMRLRSYPSFTRVVLETSAPVIYTVEARGPVTAKVKLSALAGEPRYEQVRDGHVDDVRLERAGVDAILRVTFQGDAGDIRVSTMADPPRLVIDFVRPGQEVGQRKDGVGPLKIVVLDAGHGGHDSGALGPSGLMEKDVVLDVTRRVARLVEQRLDMKVLLSRDADYFVTLKDRTRFANRERADLFVSIHANAHREVASEGVETYFLSSEATDNAARQVAALENGVVQLEKASAGGRVDIVKSILWDLAQSEFQEESSRLAEVLLDSMTHTLHIPNRGVKQAGFYVLGGAAMPAVLVEIGFVTNPREEKKLRDSRYRDEIAKSIFDGIAEYKARWDQRSKTALGGSR
jgi:N-acetylmuramoyl-L-alanine amidase